MLCVQWQGNSGPTACAHDMYTPGDGEPHHGVGQTDSSGPQVRHIPGEGGVTEVKRRCGEGRQQQAHKVVILQHCAIVLPKRCKTPPFSINVPAGAVHNPGPTATSIVQDKWQKADCLWKQCTAQSMRGAPARKGAVLVASTSPM